MSPSQPPKGEASPRLHGHQVTCHSQGTKWHIPRATWQLSVCPWGRWRSKLRARHWSVTRVARQAQVALQTLPYVMALEPEGEREALLGKNRRAAKIKNSLQRSHIVISHWRRVKYSVWFNIWWKCAKPHAALPPLPYTSQPGLLRVSKSLFYFCQSLKPCCAVCYCFSQDFILGWYWPSVCAV